MTEINESIKTSGTDPEKSIEAVVIELEFINCFKDCLNKTTIKPPHWPATIDALSQSSKPAVFAFDNKGTQKAKVKIKVTSKGYGGNGKLKGLVKGLEFEGSIPLSSGEHTVEVTLKEPPTAVLWIKNKISWGVEATDRSVLAGNTPVEIFFVFSDPSKMAFFSKNGVWVEALRFIISKGKLESIKKDSEAVGYVTAACFSLPNHKYEVQRGGANFGGGSRTFSLKKYMDGSEGAVNCYDQTYSVIVFSGALGINVDGLFMEPFGYIKAVNLVGWGRCNNPFPQRKPTKDYLVVNPTDNERQPFGNHMFCEFKVKIYDACAGPVKGTVDRAGYVTNTIDTTMPANADTGFPGTIANIGSIALIRGSINANVTDVE